MAAVTICSDLGAQKNSVSLFPPLFAMKWWDQMPWSQFFWMLSFKPTFYPPLSLWSRDSGSSSLSAIRVVSSAYLRLLIFLPAILSLACASSSPAFFMMYSAYKLNKQGDNIALMYSFPNLKPVCCSMSSSNCCSLTLLNAKQIKVLKIYIRSLI